MCALRIVVDRQRDWQPYHPSDDVIDADHYIDAADIADARTSSRAAATWASAWRKTRRRNGWPTI